MTTSLVGHVCAPVLHAVTPFVPFVGVLGMYLPTVPAPPNLLIIAARHGPHTPCPLPLASKFIINYLSAPPDSSERRAIERRYGRGNVLRLVRQQEEEQENRKWLDSSTMACPGCEVRVEKSVGCNHVRIPLLYVLGRQGGQVRSTCHSFAIVPTTYSIVHRA